MKRFIQWLFNIKPEIVRVIWPIPRPIEWKEGHQAELKGFLNTETGKILLANMEYWEVYNAGKSVDKAAGETRELSAGKTLGLRAARSIILWMATPSEDKNNDHTEENIEEILEERLSNRMKSSSDFILGPE